MIHFVLSRETSQSGSPFSKICHDLVRDLQPSPSLSSESLDARYISDDMIENHINMIIDEEQQYKNKYIFVECYSFFQMNTVRFLLSQKGVTCQTMCIKKTGDKLEEVYDHIVNIDTYDDNYSSKFHIAEDMMKEFKIIAKTTA